MITKYGECPTVSFSEYKKSLINRIWCLIPLREENCKTIRKNIERINRELNGLLSVNLHDDKYLITIINLLENIIDEDDFQIYRADVLRCCELVKRLDGGDVNV